MKKINKNLILLGKELVFTECQSVNFQKRESTGNLQIRNASMVNTQIFEKMFRPWLLLDNS